MDRSRDYQTKWRKLNRERKISYDITYTWNLKKKKARSDLIYKTEKKLMVTKVERLGGEIN